MIQQVSLELSKKLKEAGYKQEGLWWWVIYGSSFEFSDITDYKRASNYEPPTKLFTSPTVAEMGEVLPEQYGLPYKTESNEWCYDGYIIELQNDLNFSDIKTEADARAMLWLYLKKKGLI